MAGDQLLDPNSYWARKHSRRGILRMGAGLGAIAALGGFAVACSDDDNGATGGATGGSDTIKVGILHSLSGTMSISEVSVRDSEVLALEELNAAGGVLGRQLEWVIEDGASDWPTFREKSVKLLTSDRVATVFGCWTSASRQAVLPEFEGHNGLLWYPVQYEGLESSPNIMYMGATTNQQIVPSVEYLLEEGMTRFFLLASDYVFPRTANRIINAQLAATGGETVAEEYTPLGHTDYSTIINRIRSANPDVIYNTLNGDSNVAFFKQLADAGLGNIPTMSVSVAEEEVRGIGADVMEGHMVAWNYFQTTPGEANERFVAAYKEKYGADRVTADPIEAGYIGVHLWAKAVEAAGSIEVDAVRAAAPGLTFEAPGGLVTINGDNQHISKTVRIGRIRADGLIDEVWATPGPVEPDPYLETYPWGGEFAAEKPS